MIHWSSEVSPPSFVVVSGALREPEQPLWREKPIRAPQVLTAWDCSQSSNGIPESEVLADECVAHLGYSQGRNERLCPCNSGV
jgi:hypothetical protein